MNPVSRIYRPRKSITWFVLETSMQELSDVKELYLVGPSRIQSIKVLNTEAFKPNQPVQSNLFKLLGVTFYQKKLNRKILVHSENDNLVT